MSLTWPLDRWPNMTPHSSHFAARWLPYVGMNLLAAAFFFGIALPPAGPHFRHQAWSDIQATALIMVGLNVVARLMVLAKRRWPELPF